MSDDLTGKVPLISLEEVKNASDSSQKVIILDVRTKDEVTRGRISNSINIPLDELSEKIFSAVPDKNSIIYVYCLTATRSAAAVNFLRNNGYKNSYNMEYGLLGWRAKFYPVEK